MNQKKEKDETNGYRNTNGKESDDAEELAEEVAEGQSSGMTVSTWCEHYGKAVKTPTWIDIDTGAAYDGGSPMLLRLDDMKEFYI